MALTINPKITFNGKEATEGILEPAFQRPEMRRIMDIRENIKAKEQIAFLGRIDKVTKKDGGAGTGKQNRSLAMSEKFWDPAKLKIWISLTQDDLEGTFFVWLTKNGVDRRNVEDLTEFYQQWVLEVFADAAQSDALRIAYFGDKDIANVSDSGVLANTASVDDYNQIDGFWKQLFAAVTATKTKRITIAKNSEANYAAQLALGTTDAYDTYRKMINIADSRLRQAPDKVFLVTETLFQNRIDEKESKSPGVYEMIKRQDQAYNDDQYRNIPIISMDNVWDKYIQSDFANGTAYDLPHRAILTTVSNLVAGFDSAGGIDDFRTYFDENSESVNFKGLYKFDAKVMEEFMTVVAY
jgi:hypothetical protein